MQLRTWQFGFWIPESYWTYVCIESKGFVEHQDGNIILPRGGIIFFVWNQMSHNPNLLLPFQSPQVVVCGYGFDMRRFECGKAVSCTQEEP